MGEAALFGIAKSVLQQIASPALDEFRLLWGHKANLEKLEGTVNTIKDVLEDADRKQATEAAVRGWLARLRVVLYDAEDLFDAISVKFLLKKEKKGTKIEKKVHSFLSKPYHFALFVKNAHRVKEIRERFDDIAQDIKGFNFLPIQTDLNPTSSRIERESTYSYVPSNEVIGREIEKEDLVRMLLPNYSKEQNGVSAEEQKGVSVISIIGIGGLGKTTLAQLVYNDDRVKQGFELCMWACIYKFSTLKQIVIQLLKSATMRAPENLEIDQLQKMFRKEIEGKRFLLVLDDVWDEDPKKWSEVMKHMLSSGKDGSKVLTTTRSEIVAQSLDATKPYFHLKGMSDESAWLLFKKIAFGEDGDQNSSDFEELGQQIVSKCANVPLAIVTIASLLREKEKKEWLFLVNNELSKVVQYKNITQVLALSYKNLSYSEKCCFGYCSLFPKGYVFEKDILIRLWIAQGLVEPQPQLIQSLEDRGEGYFFNLVKRCFFQLTARDEEKKSNVTYQMHDLMHDLAMEVVGSESILVDHAAQGSWDKNVRHLSINCKWESMVQNVCSFSHSKSLRTFLHPRGDILENNALKNLLPNFKYLRVLTLWRIQEVPTSIGELIHIRFLDLSWSYMERLPSSICSLPCLRSLILRGCSSLEEFPNEMGDSLSLTFLDLSESNMMEGLLRSICSLRHLQFLILQQCYALKDLPENLGDMRSLRLLDLSKNEIMESLPRSICSLPHLESLILLECKALEELPEDLGDLQSLRLLDLSKSYSLERLPGSICKVRHLESLILQECKLLKELPEELGDLLSLRYLVLEGCDRLVKMPPGLAALTSLVTLDRLVVHSPSGGLQYLERLDNLTGSLQIELPSTEWESATTDAAKSSLSKKTRLHSLAIIFKLSRWDSKLPTLREPATVEPATTKPATAHTKVNALQLPPNLGHLSIIYVSGKEMLNEVSRLHKLVILKLKGCKRCVKLPPLSHLPSLKKLRISGMDSISTIEESKSYEPDLFFPSLETLSIKDMWNLTGWWLQAPTVLPTFPRLTRVIISNCRRLTRCIPLFPVVEHLELEYVREEIIWHIIGSEAKSSISHGKSVMKKLVINQIEDVRSIEEAQIRHLSAIQDLRIRFCYQLKSIAMNGLAYLTSLEHLEIDIWVRMNWGGQEEEVRRIHLPWVRMNWDGQEEEVRSIHLPRVKHLEIPMSRNLFKGLKDMASLETLSIWNIFNEKLQEKHVEEGLPWKHLRKLQLVHLRFGEGFRMRNNKRLLNGFQYLTSLYKLKLWECKELYLSWRSLLGLPHLQLVEMIRVEEVIDVDSDPMMIHTHPISSSIRKLSFFGGSGGWIHDIPWKSLHFLEELSLDGMRNLKSLPEGIQHLSALRSFKAWDCCEELKNRCNIQTGEDWPKIQHIQRIVIKQVDDLSNT